MKGKKNNIFLQAQPVWIKNKRNVPNLQVGFRCDFFAEQKKNYVLKITGATYYRIYLNGEFAGYGPARAGHGYVKCDEMNLPVEEGLNQLAVEVAGYNCTSFYTMPHVSFLCAEILEEGEVILYTGRDFQALSLDKLRNIYAQRYSYQRGYGEVWNFDGNDPLTDWITAEGLSYEPVWAFPIEEEYLERGLPLPNYKVIQALEVAESGKRIERDFTELKMPRYITELSNRGGEGYSMSDWTENPLRELYGEFLPDDEKSEGKDGRYTLNRGEYIIFRLPFNDTGFLRNRIQAWEDSKALIFFAEYKDGRGMIFQGLEGQCNIVAYNLKKNNKPYQLESFEPYTCQYIGVAVVKGRITLDAPEVREYSYPEYENLSLETADSELKGILDAAVNTFRQNTLDVFMDCPGRERAGWLCDSYFTSQSERMFTGKSTVEKVFLENFVMAKEFPNIPNGMLPHNYPPGIKAYDDGYIPQWAMWYVVELGEYCQKRTGENPEKYRTLCYGLLSWLKQYENEDGLLERMPGWNFVEWSKANDWTQDVNYPTNMLYSKMLSVMSELFWDETLNSRSEKLKEKIVEQSFDGEFFIDNAIRDENGVLKQTQNHSETCQYYAYFFGVANKEEKKYQKLTETLIDVFGPEREKNHVLAQIAPANAFIGNYLRIIILLRMRCFDRAMQNIRGYFGRMAELTGTLWEHSKLNVEYAGVSLNHGFASYAGVALIMALCGISDINYVEKRLQIDQNYVTTINYSVAFGTSEGRIRISEYNEEKLIELPEGWKCARI